MRAATSGVLDRALDVAAALEVRGYGAARRPARTRRPYSRQDLGFAAGALGVVALAIAMRAGGLAAFTAYPSFRWRRVGSWQAWGWSPARWRRSWTAAGSGR
jgi:energy-coupling factor transport system permease protein